jgi:pilus assembly protein CpaB
MGRSRSTLLLLVLSAAMAMVGLWLMQGLINRRVLEELGKRKQPQTTDEMVRVLFTACDIPMRTEIKADMLTTRELPRSAVQGMKIESEILNSPDEAAAQFSKVPFVANEPLLRNKLINRDEAIALSFRIPEGKRAVTVRIDEAKAVGYSVVPGDRVDIIGLFSVEEGEGKACEHSQTVLQDVEVLEINVGANPNTTHTPQPVATLAVTPDQAEVHVLTELAARTHFALKPFSETGRSVETSGQTIRSILGREAAPTIADVPKPETGKSIQIFSGTTPTTISVPR